MNQLLPDDLAGNTLPTALDLGRLDLNPFTQNFSDAVDGADTKDFYQFSLQAASQVALSLEGLNANANLFLIDSTGKTINRSTNLDSASELITQSLEPGTYYVLVNSPQLNGYPATTYNLGLSAQFLTDDVIVSDPNVPLPDPEFDLLGDRVTWTDGRGNLWVAPVDAQTGNFILEQAVLVDTGLARLSMSNNGPEWIYTQDGQGIVYTKLIDGSMFLGYAQWNGNQWQAGALTDQAGQPIPGFAPVGTLNPDDPSPLINYATIDGKRAWLELENPGVGGLLPGSGIRWIEGEPAVLQFSRVNGIGQVFINEVYTGIQTQLTFDNTNKRGESFMWKSPEFNNELVFFTGEIVTNAPNPAVEQLGIYREIEGQWVKIKTIQSPSPDRPFIISPEPFIFQGKSYVFMLLTDQGSDGNANLEGSELWIASIDPADNFFRKVSQDGGSGKNNDPEAFVTETGAFVYYSIYAPQENPIVRKTETGLGISEPPQDNIETRELGLLDINPFGQNFSDAVGEGNTRDSYSFSLQAASQVQFSLDGLSSNANLFLGDARGNILASSTNPGTDSESIAQPLDPGIYYVLVRSDSQANNPDTTYNLSLSAQFITNDVPMSEIELQLLDPEFDRLGDRVTWQDSAGNLWVAPVDAQTGNFLLEEALLLDTGLASLSMTRKGPDWIYTEDGAAIVYTKLVGGSMFLGYAQWNGSQWESGLLTDAAGQSIGGLAPVGTTNPQDPSPLLNYTLPSGSRAWLELENPGLGGSLPGAGVRWVEGEPAVLQFARVGGQSQVFKNEVYTGIQTQLTFDSTNKNGDAFMWRAPEFNDEQVFFSGEVLNNSPNPLVQQLGIYREIEGEWSKIKTIQSPVTELPFFFSPEPFVYNDKSYIFTLLTKQSSNGNVDFQGSEVWITSVDPADNFWRQVSQDGNAGRNNDPELFVTETGAFIYYTEVLPDQTRIIHKADTGLGVPFPEYNDIIGTSAADTLLGTSNSDRLSGGLGADTLTGGGGSDLFVYQNAQEGRDTITDFEVGQDKIDLTQVFDSLGYQGSTPLNDGYLQLVNNSSVGGVIVRIDPDGPGGAQTFLPLVVVTGVDAATLLAQNSISW